jgi:hypothetical protein
MKSSLPEYARLTPDKAAKAGVPPHLASTKLYGPFGVFLLTHRLNVLRCIVGVDAFWEHVSVSLAHRTPTWEEMAFVKDTFWEDEDTVVQFHPPKSVYVNCHPYVLHLWRNIAVPFPLPPTHFVGPLSHAPAHPPRA